MSCYVHEVPGRMRIKIPSMKRNPRVASEIRALLKKVTGVGTVSVNMVTGSVVVQYDRDAVRSDTILSFLSREGHIDLHNVVFNEPYVESTFSKVGIVVSKALLGYALDRAFQGTPLAVLTAFI
jgi:hypothetical protein